MPVGSQAAILSPLIKMCFTIVDLGGKLTRHQPMARRGAVVTGKETPTDRENVLDRHTRQDVEQLNSNAVQED